MKVKFVCSRPDCQNEGERYRSQIRNIDRLYCSVRCKHLDESRFQIGERNSNYRSGKHLDIVCECGGKKDRRSKTCADCKDTSYVLENLKSIPDPDKIFVVGNRRRNQVVIKTLSRLGLIPNECAVCQNKAEWQGSPLKLQLDHINGNAFDNRIENLRFLCPNCHSQTDTWGYRGRERERD